MVVLACYAEVVFAQDTLVYSFESDTEGFGPNGAPGPPVITQDTIGATEGMHSMKVDIPSNGFFVGALTADLKQAIGDPPGLDHVLVDMTITEEFNPPPAPPGFAVISITVFGVSQPDFPGGQIEANVQYQLEEKHIDGLAPGTYTDLRFDMNNGFHPLTGEAATFDEIFGTEGSGAADVIPTGFQFYFNKSFSPSDHPLTVYLDNVRVGKNVPGDYNQNGVVDAADYTYWRDRLNETMPLPNTDPADLDDTVTIDEYNYWVSRFGATSGSASANVGSTAVPEPAALVLWILAGLCCWGKLRRRELFNGSQS